MFPTVPDLRLLGAVIASLALCLIGVDIVRQPPEAFVGVTSIILWIGLSLIACLGLSICALAPLHPSSHRRKKREAVEDYQAVQSADLAQAGAFSRKAPARGDITTQPERTALVIRGWLEEGRDADA